MKKGTQSGRSPTAPAYPGTAPRAKRKEPMAKRTAIHQPRARGAHHVPAGSGAPVLSICLRCRRDSHRATTPSGRSVSTKVTNGPTPPRRPPDGIDPPGRPPSETCCAPSTTAVSPSGRSEDLVALCDDGAEFDRRDRPRPPTTTTDHDHREDNRWR